MVVRGWEFEGLGGKGEGVGKYELVVTAEARGCKAQHREGSQ